MSSASSIDPTGVPLIQQVSADLCRPLTRRPGIAWWLGFLGALALTGWGAWAAAYQVRTGIGVWGVDRSVGWAVDITSFVFWIGIGHAGTFISAILFLMRRGWRSRVSRTAEAATLLAVVCAAIFPLLHLGRPWLAFWMLPYPNTRGSLWINFLSPLVWDFFAIGTYFIISLTFFYLGLVPDLAQMKRQGLGARIVRRLSLSWIGTRTQWRRYHNAYLAMAGMASVLVISVHTVVSWDFAVSLVPGWHSPLFAPYFVVGAVYSGLAVVVLLTLGVRRAYGLGNYLGNDVISRIGLLMAGCAAFLGLVYVLEVHHWLTHGTAAESHLAAERLAGELAPLFVLVVAANALVPQLLWIPALRGRPAWVAAVSAVILPGMWLERYLIVVGSLERDYLPSSWSGYTPTLVEVATFAGTIGLFCTGFLLFCRLLPVMPMHEVKASLLDREREDW